MARPTKNNEIEIEIAAALGLKTELLKSFSIHFDAAQALKLIATFYVDQAGADGLLEVIKKYRLKVDDLEHSG